MNKKGFLFGAVELVPSIFIVVAILLTAVSQLPDVKDNFRRKKAVAMCEETGAPDCQAMVDSWSDEAVLDYIKDDAPISGGNNGNFNGGLMK